MAIFQFRINVIFSAKTYAQAEEKSKWISEYLNNMPLPLNSPKGIEKGLRFVKWEAPIKMRKQKKND